MRSLVCVLLIITACCAGCDIFIDEYVAPDCEGGKLDENNGICWQHPMADGNLQYEDALDYCDSLVLGDHSDWVLPSIQDFFELLGGCSAYELTGSEVSCKSCEDSVTCFGMFGADDKPYVSSTTAENGVCVMHFDGGWMNYAELSFPGNVRCIRHE